jgi:hypothetical protein
MSFWTRLILELPRWSLYTACLLFGALEVHWFFYLALFPAFMVVLGLLSYLDHALRGVLPLPTPIARALGRDRRR